VKIRTGNSNAIDVVGNKSLVFHDLVQLGSSAMENDRVKSDLVQETQGEGQLVDVVEHSTADLDEGELGGLGRM